MREEQLNSLFSEAYTAAASSSPHKEKRRKNVVVALGSDGHSRAAHIRMLQHLAYHDRLVPALKAAL